MSHSIKTAFVKWVAPYEEYLAENGKLEGDPIELNTSNSENKDSKTNTHTYDTRHKEIEMVEEEEEEYDDASMSDGMPFGVSSKDNAYGESKHRHVTRQQNGTRRKSWLRAELNERPIDKLWSTL